MSDLKLPGGWKADILQNITNQIIDGTHYTPVCLENGIPFLRVTDIQNNYIDKKNIKYISFAAHKLLIKRCNPEFGDILYSKNGTVGIPKIVNWNWKFSIFVSLCLIKIKQNEISPQFLLNYLCSENIKQQIHKRAKQGTIINLHLEEIREFTINFPKSLPEQKKIAKILTTIDNTIEKTEQLIEKLANIKKGLMHDLFTRGVDENGQLRPPYEEAPHLYKESELGWIPKEWEVKRLDKLCKVRQGLQIPISKRFLDEGSNRYIYITVQYIHNIENKKNIEYIEKPPQSVICNSDDILMTRTGNTGEVLTDVQGVFHNNFFLVDYIREKLCKYFFVYWLNRDGVQTLISAYAGITTIPDLKHKDFYRLIIARPKKNEQKVIEKILLTTEHQISMEVQKHIKLKNLKQGLMEDLLTGKVRVTSLLKKGKK